MFNLTILICPLVFTFIIFITVIVILFKNATSKRDLKDSDYVKKI